jgi:hypothetical protein
MALLYGLSALLSTYGLRHISQLSALESITEKERAWVVRALGSEPEGRRYWNGRADPWAKGPGPVTGTSRQNHGRKNVINKFPFADAKASAARVVRRGVPVPQPEQPKPVYKAMNDFGVPPLFSLNPMTRSKVVQKTFAEVSRARASGSGTDDVLLLCSR